MGLGAMDTSGPMMFCKPNTSESAIPGLEGFGFGCGNGICAPSGMYCVCEEAYTHSFYLFMFQDCWNTKALKWSVLALTSALMLGSLIHAAWAAKENKNELRRICILLVFTNLFFLLSNLTLYLERMTGVATTLSYCLGIFFGLTALARITWMFLGPSLRMSGRHNYARRTVLPTIFIPGLLTLCFFFSSVPAYVEVYPRPADQNYLEFNRRLTAFFFMIGYLPYVLCVAPLIVMLLLFDRVFVTKSSDSRSREGEGSAPRSTPLPETHSKSDTNASGSLLRTSALQGLLRRFTVGITALIFINTVFCTYLAVTVLAYNQAPVQVVSFAIMRTYGPGLTFFSTYLIRNAKNVLAPMKAKNRVGAGSKEENESRLRVGGGSKEDLSKLGSTLVHHVPEA